MFGLVSATNPLFGDTKPDTKRLGQTELSKAIFVVFRLLLVLDFMGCSLKRSSMASNIWPSPRSKRSVQATFETSRLILRPFELGDVESAFGWFGDPTVMRFTPAGPDTSIDLSKARLANYQEHQTTHGFSKCIIL